MHISDGMVHGSEPEATLEVVRCRYVGDEIFLVTFSTGETRLFDATRLYGMSAFEPLKDPTVLEEFAIEDGVLTWMQGKIDIAPEGLYSRSFEYDTAT